MRFVGEEGKWGDLPSRNAPFGLIDPGAHLHNNDAVIGEMPGKPAQNRNLLTPWKGFEDVVDDQDRAESLMEVERLQPLLDKHRPTTHLPLPGMRARVGEHRGTGVHANDVVPEFGQRHGVDTRSAGSVEDGDGRLRQQAAQAPDVCRHDVGAAGGAVVRLVEMLTEEPPAQQGVAPVQLDGGVEWNRPVVEAGE